MTAFWTCCRCDRPIEGDDPHTDPETGGDVHEECCASCHPHLAEQYGIDLDVTTSDLRAAAETARAPLRDDEGQPLILGHPGPTQDQAARGERTR